MAIIAASSNRYPALTQRVAPSTWLFEIGLRAPNPPSASFRHLSDIPSGSRGKMRTSRTTGSRPYTRQSPETSFDSSALARLLLVKPAIPALRSPSDILRCYSIGACRSWIKPVRRRQVWYLRQQMAGPSLEGLAVKPYSKETIDLWVSTFSSKEQHVVSGAFSVTIAPYSHELWCHREIKYICSRFHSQCPYSLAVSAGWRRLPLLHTQRLVSAVAVYLHDS